MSITFERHPSVSRYLDPQSDFALKELAVEVRIHPLTGHVTRFARLGMADFGEYELPEAIAGSAIPIFAPPLVTQITPKFANEDGPERYARGDSVLFPNLNPYDEHSPVVAIGKRPLVEPHDLSPTDIADALILMRDFFRDLDPPQDAGVVGWNFWPASSSSIPHPHIQGISSGRIPTRQQVERDGENRHRAEHNSDFWADYLDAERDGERWIGEAEGWSAVVDFAPRSLVPETVIIATDGTPGHLQEATEEDAALVADWLTRVAAAHASLGISSFNVLIHPTASPDRQPTRLRMRFMPRIHPAAKLHSSDWTWVQMGTDEALTAILPETWAHSLRDALSQVKPSPISRA